MFKDSEVVLEVVKVSLCRKDTLLVVLTHIKYENVMYVPTGAPEYDWNSCEWTHGEECNSFLGAAGVIKYTAEAQAGHPCLNV